MQKYKKMQKENTEKYSEMEKSGIIHKNFKNIRKNMSIIFKNVIKKY